MEMAEEKIRITIPEAEDDRLKSWRKRVVAVDRTKSNGYAFEGEWLRAGRDIELPEGAIVLMFDEVGSRRNHEAHVRVCRVAAGAVFIDTDWRHTEYQGLELVAEATGQNWALDVRDQTAEML